MSDETPQYRWPWVLLLFLVLFLLLAVVWMLAEVKRMKRIRDLNHPSPMAVGTTNKPTATPPN